MYMMKLVLTGILLLLVFLENDAFTPNVATYRRWTRLAMNISRRESLAKILVAGTVSSIPQLVSAETIKLVDTSLPTYEEIKSPKASVGNVESLTIDPSKIKKAKKVNLPTRQGKQVPKEDTPKVKKEKTDSMGYIVL